MTDVFQGQSFPQRKIQLSECLDRLGFLRQLDEEIRGITGPVLQEILRRDAETDDVEPEHHLYDIIIPNFNSMEVFPTCLDTLIQYTDPRHQILIVDDASTEAGVEPMLQDYAARFAHVRYIRSQRNLGFPGTVNTGLAMTRNDVVLVNCDTEFSPGWLARMDRCRRSNRRIHTVTPLSNNATICSVPQMNFKNLLPEGMTVPEMARLVARTSLRRYPRVPTGVGFCFLVTRKLIERVGMLDMTFGRGYGEEVDWCQRAWALGMESVLCDDAYVFHHGEVSYSKVPERKKLQQDNDARVKKRWPSYHATVYTYTLMNPLRVQHQRLYETLRRRVRKNGPSVLQVVHKFGIPAGTELHTRELADSLQEDMNVSVLYPADFTDWCDAKVETEPGGLHRVLMKSSLHLPSVAVRGLTTELRAPLVERFFAQLMAGGGYNVVHFQHLSTYGSLALPIIAARMGSRVVITLHDYFWLCPDWNLVGQASRFCGKSRVDEGEECRACTIKKLTSQDGSKSVVFSEWVRKRNSLVETALGCADVLVVPSRFARDLLAQSFNEAVVNRVQVIPHGTRPFQERAVYEKAVALRVAFLGNMDLPKGRRVFLQAVSRLRNRKINFTVVGDFEDSPDIREAATVKFTGKYRRDDLPRLLSQVDVVVIPSIWHETYCYTVDEAFRLGIPVVSSRVGAIAERVRHGENGLLFEAGDPDDLAKTLLCLDEDRGLLTRLRQTVAAMQFKSLQENMAEYHVLYSRLLKNPLAATEMVQEALRKNRECRVEPSVTLDEYLKNLPPLG